MDGSSHLARLHDEAMIQNIPGSYVSAWLSSTLASYRSQFAPLSVPQHYCLPHPAPTVASQKPKQMLFGVSVHQDLSQKAAGEGRGSSVAG